MDQSFYHVWIRPAVDGAPVILASAFVWWILADFVFSKSGLFIPGYNKLTERQKIEWNGRLVAMAHACVAITVCPGFLFPDTNLVSIDPITNATVVHNFVFDPFVNFIFKISIGYFIWDSVVCIYHNWGFEYVAHGILCVVTFYLTLYPFLHHWGRFYLGFFELSTIPLHFRGCMIMLGYHKNEEKKHLFMLAQNVWVVVYTLSRVFMGTYVTYHFVQDMLAVIESGNYHSLFAMRLILLLNVAMMTLMYYWMYQIIAGLFARGRQNDRRDNEDEQNGKTNIEKKKNNSNTQSNENNKNGKKNQ